MGRACAQSTCRATINGSPEGCCALRKPRVIEFALDQEPRRGRWKLCQSAPNSWAVSLSALTARNSRKDRGTGLRSRWRFVNGCVSASWIFLVVFKKAGAAQRSKLVRLSAGVAPANKRDLLQTQAAKRRQECSPGLSLGVCPIGKRRSPEWAKERLFSPLWRLTFGLASTHRLTSWAVFLGPMRGCLTATRLRLRRRVGQVTIRAHALGHSGIESLVGAMMTSVTDDYPGINAGGRTASARTALNGTISR